jgi:plastocyanin
MRRSVLLALLSVLAFTAASCGAPKDTGFPPTPSPTETEHDGGDTSTPDDPAAYDGPIDVVDSRFVPRYVAVESGTAVTWSQSGSAPHNVVSAKKGAFNSHPKCLKDTSTCMASGDEFTFTFEDKGDFIYYCQIHGRPTNLDDPANMAGIIFVE